MEELYATEGDDGSLSIATADGLAVDICRPYSVEGGMAARCDQGWDGPLIYAGSDASTADSGILVVLNSVFYRACD